MFIIPNVLTLLRLLMVPLVIFLLMQEKMIWALIVFVVAGLTDGLDGYLARCNNWRTQIGAFLDPLADKALLLSIYITLGLYGFIPAWFVAIVVCRDAAILAGIGLTWYLQRPMPVRPLYIGKAYTAGLILLAALLLADLGLDLGLANLTNGMLYLLAALTILSALAYLRGWIRHMFA